MIGRLQQGLQHILLFRNAQNVPLKELNFHNFLEESPQTPQIKGSSHVNVSILNVIFLIFQDCLISRSNFNSGMLQNAPFTELNFQNFLGENPHTPKLKGVLL